MRLARGLLIVAGVPLLLGAIPSLATLAGCVVASTPAYSAPDECPPAFVTNEADPPIGDITLINVNSTSPLEFAATIPVRSCAVARPLEGRAFLNGAQVSGSLLQPTGDVSRQLKFTISLQAKPLRCYKVEYYVTTRFLNIGPDSHTPEKQGDLAYVAWQVDLYDGTISHALDSCPRGSIDAGPP